jgi:hypothetical protein
VDLDGKTETPDNIIVYQNGNENDYYAIDGMRLTDRTNSVVKRGVYDIFPTKEQRRINDAFINKIYKKYLRQYLTPEERAVHPFNEAMVTRMDAQITAKESIYSRVHRAVVQMLKSWGFTMKKPDGSALLTFNHYGSITGKVASYYYKTEILPLLASNSSWRDRIPNSKQFFLTEQGKAVMNDKSFKQSMMATFLRMGSDIPIDPGVFGNLLVQASNSEGVSVTPNPNGTVTVIDPQAEQLNRDRLNLQSQRSTIPQTRAGIWESMKQRYNNNSVPQTPPLQVTPQQLDQLNAQRGAMRNVPLPDF